MFSIFWLLFFGSVFIYLVNGVLVVLIFSFLLWLIGQGVLYIVYFIGVRPRYLLGVADQDDVYFPRFDILRLLYMDEIKRKEKGESRKELEEKSEKEDTNLNG